MGSYTFPSFFLCLPVTNRDKIQRIHGLRFRSMMLQGLHSNIPQPLTLLRRSSLHKKLNQKNWEMCWHFWNLHILRWHYEWQWFEWWMQQGRIDMLISFTWSGITTRVLQPAKIKLSGWQTSKLLEQVVPVAAVHKDVGLQKSFLYPYHSWDVMKPSPTLGLSPLGLVLAVLEPFWNDFNKPSQCLLPKDSVSLLLRILKQGNESLKTSISTHQVFITSHFTCGSCLSSF